jgi:hypothetical protein
MSRIVGRQVIGEPWASATARSARGCSTSTAVGVITGGEQRAESGLDDAECLRATAVNRAPTRNQLFGAPLGARVAEDARLGVRSLHPH